MSDIFFHIKRASKVSDVISETSREQFNKALKRLRKFSFVKAKECLPAVTSESDRAAIAAAIEYEMGAGKDSWHDYCCPCSNRLCFSCILATEDQCW